MEKCLRCRAEFDDPVPEVTNPEGEITEIACVHWCPGCNAITMSVLFREKSAYQLMPLALTKGKLGYSEMPRRLVGNEH